MGGKSSEHKLSHYVNIWWHSQNQKYLTYALSLEEEQATENMHRKFPEVWICGFWDMNDRQTSIETCYLQYVVSLLGAK